MKSFFIVPPMVLLLAAAQAQTPVLTAKKQNIIKSAPVLIQTQPAPPAPEPAAAPIITGFKQVRENTVYRIMCKFSAMQVEVEDALFAKGKKVQQWAWNDGDAFKDQHNQRWMLMAEGYDAQRGAHFRIMNYGFLKFLAHLDNDANVFCGDFIEYSWQLKDKWYLKPVAGMPNQMEIRSVHNNKRLRLAAPNNNEGTGFIIEDGTEPNAEAAFQIYRDGEALAEPRFLNTPVKFKNDENQSFFLSVWPATGAPVCKEGGNIAGNDQTERFMITRPTVNYYRIKSLYNNQYLQYEYTQKKFSFTADSLKQDCQFSLVPLERQRGKYFIRPAWGECLLGKGNQYVAGGGLSTITVGLGSLQNLPSVRWVIDY